MSQLPRTLEHKYYSLPGSGSETSESQIEQMANKGKRRESSEDDGEAMDSPLAGRGPKRENTTKKGRNPKVTSTFQSTGYFENTGHFENNGYFENTGHLYVSGYFGNAGHFENVDNTAIGDSGSSIASGEQSPVHEQSVAASGEQSPVYEHSVAASGEQSPVYEYLTAASGEQSPVHEHSVVASREQSRVQEYITAAYGKQSPIQEYLNAAYGEQSPVHEHPAFQDPESVAGASENSLSQHDNGKLQEIYYNDNSIADGDQSPLIREVYCYEDLRPSDSDDENGGPGMLLVFHRNHDEEEEVANTAPKGNDDSTAAGGQSPLMTEQDDLQRFESEGEDEVSLAGGGVFQTYDNNFQEVDDYDYNDNGVDADRSTPIHRYIHQKLQFSDSEDENDSDGAPWGKYCDDKSGAETANAMARIESKYIASGGPSPPMRGRYNSPGRQLFGDFEFQSESGSIDAFGDGGLHHRMNKLEEEVASTSGSRYNGGYEETEVEVKMEVESTLEQGGLKRKRGGRKSHSAKKQNK